MEPEDEDELMKTLVSPFCEEIFYCYYGDEDDGLDDIKEWEIKDYTRGKRKRTGGVIVSLPSLNWSSVGRRKT